VITFTEPAKNKIKKLLSTRGGIGITIGVKTTGCSGLAYVLEYIDKYDPDNNTINYGQNDFVVIVKSMTFILLA
jgi:iron-sulfur cluster assembly protein